MKISANKFYEESFFENIQNSVSAEKLYIKKA